MAKVVYTGSVTGFRGKIGNLIFRQMPNGTIVVSAAPPKNTGRQKKRAKLKRSARQNAHNDHFKEASAYAKWAARTKPIYAELAAATVMRTAYNLALSDWFNPPEIHRIERRDGRILVEATDNILVAKVQVTILDEQGKPLETGQAIEGEGNWWEFTPQTSGTSILAKAWDLPGHVTKLVLS